MVFIPSVVVMGLLALSASGLRAVLDRYPADSLVPPLRRYESEHSSTPEGGEAALMLGRLHYARGEYRQAAEVFARAAARLAPARKSEARYWGGLCWLALRESGQARALLEEVAQSNSGRRVDAQLGVALAWEQAKRPDRALEVLERVASAGRNEALPSALERMIAVADRLHKPELAARARTRLFRDYPRSIEAVRAGLEPVASTAATTRSIEVRIGAFSSPSRARSLLGAARRAGFPAAQVVTRGEGRSRLYVVRIGVFPSRAEARLAGERAARKLGVTSRVVETP